MYKHSRGSITLFINNDQQLNIASLEKQNYSLLEAQTTQGGQSPQWNDLISTQ